MGEKKTAKTRRFGTTLKMENKVGDLKTQYMAKIIKSVYWLTEKQTDQ